jgi:pimeloyl-ACP methyl ester carboxylesterase
MDDYIAKPIKRADPFCSGHRTMYEMKQNSIQKQHISCRTFYVCASACRLRVKSIAGRSDSVATDRPTLVFLHEGLGCIELWRDFPETLCQATGCSGLVYDRKGYGGSEKLEEPWPLDYLQKESLIYLPELLKECHIDRAVLIGHSDGGTIALITAAIHGNVVCAVITEAAHIFVEEVTIAGIRKAVEAFETTPLKKKLARYHKENTETIFYRWANRWLSPEFLTWNIEKYLPKITCPILVLQGEDDEYGTPAQVQSIVGHVSGPAHSKLIPDCGHVPHFQAKNAVLSEMTQFIRTIVT